MIRTYARIFLITGFFLFLGMLFSDLTMLPPVQAFSNAAAAGLLFGLVMSAVMGTLQVVKCRQAAGDEADRDIYSTIQSRQFESGLEYARLFAAAEHYLQKTRGFTLTERDQEAGKISASTPFNFTTFGSRVTVRLEKREGAPTLVKVVSRPLLFTVMCDYGENLKIAKGLEEHLRGTGQF